jgi:hypothetical protein
VRWRGACLFAGVNYSRSAALGACLLAILGPGCKSADKAHATTARGGKFFAVTADSAAFFRHGPQQGRSPDKTLPKDTIVRLIRPSFGYSKIQLVASGEQGYVLSEEIKPASATAISPAPLVAVAPVLPADSVAAPASGRFGETFKIDSNDPRLVPPPEELPNPDLPAQAPEP